MSLFEELYEIVTQFVLRKESASEELIGQYAAEQASLLSRYADDPVDPESVQTDVDSVVERALRDRLRRQQGSVALDAEDFQSWLDPSKVEWTQWNAYRQWLLFEEGRSSGEIAELRQDLDEVIDHLGNPNDNTEWQRRALLIGNVQSGKTATFLGLVNKALDVGYKAIIVLAGQTDVLRMQTQYRLEQGVVGKSSSFDKEDLGVSKRDIGVGNYGSKGAGFFVCTSMERDFNRTALKTTSTDPHAGGMSIFVCKKNKAVLESIQAWFTRDLSGEPSNTPLLIIDDESDYASVNTNDPDLDPTTINNAIRQLLGLTRRGSYVAITATPFANIFIDHEIDNDLFPRDLIFGLTPPDSYQGPKKLFGSGRELGARTIQYNDDAEEFFPFKHKKDMEIEGLPDSLVEALDCFALSNVIRDLREEDSQKRSMLINVSRYIDTQKLLTPIVESAWLSILDELRYAQSASRNRTVKRIQGVFEAHFADAGFEWGEVMPQIIESNTEVKIVTTNSLNKQLDTDGYPDRFIAIGGDKLSRGLTLDGLSTSYFYRDVRAIDTLLQMGRWFGYRPGYADLTRIWLPIQSELYFQNAADILDELDQTLRKMRAEGASPRHFGVAIKQHPETLMITAANKRRNAVLGLRKVSLRGRVFETPVLPYDASVLAYNAQLTQEFLSGVSATKAISEKRKSHLVFEAVPKVEVAEYIKAFRIGGGKYSGLFGTQSLIADYLIHTHAKDTQSVDVVVVGGSVAVPEAYEWAWTDSLPERQVFTKVNGHEANQLIVSSRQRVGGTTEMGIPLGVKAPSARSLGRSPIQQDFTARLERAALLIFPIVPKESAVSDSNFSRGLREANLGDFAQPIVAFSVMLPGQPNRESSEYAYLNTVEQKLQKVDFHQDELGEIDDGDID